MINKLRTWIDAALSTFLLFMIIFSYLPAKGQNTEIPEKADVIVNFSEITGKIKPVDGVNGGPFNYSPAAVPVEFYYAEANFPYVRLHDCLWPGGAW